MAALKLDQIGKSHPRALAVTLDQVPPPDCEAVFPEDFGRRFTVFGDAEEEFDWAAPLDRDANTTIAFVALPVANRFFGEHGIVPTYVADYPVVANAASAAVLQEMAAVGACDVGAHLHPWVNPPHREIVGPANSYAGNLPAQLEAAKLRLLTERIADLIGRRPIVYRAGRYGVGPNSARLLAELGYRIDASVRAGFDYRSDGGPDFTEFPIRPYWIGEQLLEIPLTTCLAGPLGRFAALTRIDRLRGPLARGNLLNRIPLTPEGVPLAEAKIAVETLLDRGENLFSLSFHTPSVVPGHTPYVKDGEDLALFWAWWDGMFDLFARHGVTPVRSGEIYQAAASC
jgi:hypothetical protein